MKPMNDREFLSYVRSHSQTDRALFSASDTIRFLRMAGQEELSHTVAQGSFHALHFSDIQDELRCAEKRLQKADSEHRLKCAIQTMCGGSVPLVQYLGRLQFDQSIDDENNLQIEVVDGRRVLCTITSYEDILRPSVGGKGTKAKGYRVWHTVAYDGGRDEPPGQEDATIAEEFSAENAMAAAMGFIVKEYFADLAQQRVCERQAAEL